MYEESKAKIKKFFHAGDYEMVTTAGTTGSSKTLAETFMFEPDDRKLTNMIDGFRKGDIISGDLKGYLADKVCQFLKQHQKRRELAKRKVEQFLK